MLRRPGAGTLAVAAAASGFAFGAVVFGVVHDSGDSGDGSDSRQVRLVDDGSSDQGGYRESDQGGYREYDDGENGEHEQGETGEREWGSDQGAWPGGGSSFPEPRTSTRGS